MRSLDEVVGRRPDKSAKPQATFLHPARRHSGPADPDTNNPVSAIREQFGVIAHTSQFFHCRISPTRIRCLSRQPTARPRFTINTGFISGSAFFSSYIFIRKGTSHETSQSNRDLHAA